MKEAFSGLITNKKLKHAMYTICGVYVTTTFDRDVIKFFRKAHNLKFIEKRDIDTLSFMYLITKLNCLGIFITRTIYDNV